MPSILVFKILKLQYVHKLQTGGKHHIDLVHLMTKKLRQNQSQIQTHKANKYCYFEKGMYESKNRERNI